MGKEEKETLEKELDRMILSQKGEFYSYELGREYFKRKDIENPSQRDWARIHVYISQRVKHMKESGKIRLVKEEATGKGAFPKKVYRVVKR